MNKVIIHGNLGAAPEMRATEGKPPVCVFNVATNEVQKSRTGETVKHTEWHRVVTFGKLAENCSKYLSKGAQALVEGRIRSERYKSKEGKEQLSVSIIAENVQFLTPKSSSSATPEVAGEAREGVLGFKMEEDIPF